MLALEGVCTSLQGPTSGKQMESESRAEFPRNLFCSLPNENFNIHLQRTLGHGILGELAPLIMNA